MENLIEPIKSTPSIIVKICLLNLLILHYKMGTIKLRKEIRKVWWLDMEEVIYY